MFRHVTVRRRDRVDPLRARTKPPCNIHTTWPPNIQLCDFEPSGLEPADLEPAAPTNSHQNNPSGSRFLKLRDFSVFIGCSVDSTDPSTAVVEPTLSSPVHPKRRAMHGQNEAYEPTKHDDQTDDRPHKCPDLIRRRTL